VLAQPAGELTLEAGAAVAELGQLDQVLELQVVDVVDQPELRVLSRSAVPLGFVVRAHARGGIRTRKPLRAMDFESIA
jgi:hypothetical protein